jgi:hypothetical protein
MTRAMLSKNICAIESVSPIYLTQNFPFVSSDISRSKEAHHSVCSLPYLIKTNFLVLCNFTNISHFLPISIGFQSELALARRG